MYEAGSRISQRELTTSFRTCEVFVNLYARYNFFFLNECFLAFESHLSFTIKIYGKIGSCVSLILRFQKFLITEDFGKHFNVKIVK